ncbi:hypothetical protein [Dactylosporangium sp. CA-139066]|uniref:hypothetical protein n=1 Tax=Dactylosporangium sp. CA-139066 TaxID=3239930 RepID=UPI003D8C4B94
MTNKVLVQVPPADVDDLSALAEAAEIVEARPFDGETMLQILYILSPSSLTALVTWIRARAASRKHYRIVVDGVELTGYTAAETERVLAELNRIADARRVEDALD